ncbi:hypothetical protein [uncultured Dokdonia sp.]|uniref:hypothetical protein n=1 Tax=uncultured Dokdonia sp. TaxID=575653 RepID=UPI002633E1B6|nr:hypothetical protein [uncultured Dokdonia sp.]
MNKLILIIVALTLYVSSDMKAQDAIYFTDGTVLEGSVIQMNKAKVYFENADTGDRKWHKKKIDSLVDDTDGTKITYKVRNIKGLNGVFSGELIKGKVSYYVMVKYNPAAKNYLSSYYLHREGDKAMRDLPNSLVSPYSKRMAKYFSDCSTLVKRINGKKYNYSTTSDAIEYYNSNCN